LARSLVCAGTVGGVFSSFTPTAAAPPPASPAALATRAFTTGALTGGSLAAAGVAGTRLGAARLLFRAGHLLGTRGIRPLSARIALRLRGPFGAPRCGITAILTARPPIAPRVPRSVAPCVAISVAVSAVAVPIPVAAAAATATITIVTCIATAKPFTLGLRG
jgi:hypothetical protein